MHAETIMSQIIDILTSGIIGVAQGVGTGLSNLVTSIFVMPDSQSLSSFGILVVIFAGVSLALGLCRWMVNFVTSLGARNS